MAPDDMPPIHRSRAAAAPGAGPPSLDATRSLEDRIASVERRLKMVETELEHVNGRVEAINRAKQTLTMVLMDLVADMGESDG